MVKTMTMKKEELLSLMSERGGRITTSAAIANGYPSSLLKLLMSEGAVELESRGVYALADVQLDDFAVIALRWPKAIFSNGCALWLLGLSDRVPQTNGSDLPTGLQCAGSFGGIPVDEDSQAGARALRAWRDHGSDTYRDQGTCL